MVDISQFNIQGHKVRFELVFPDQEIDFLFRFPKEYQFEREYMDVLKDIPLMMWGNAIGFTNPEECYIDFEVSQDKLEFWKWVGEQNALLDAHYSDRECEWSEPNVEVGSDTSSLLDVTPDLPDQDYEGTMICQSTGKESLSSLHIIQELDESPIHSMFMGYPSRAATHKQASREAFKEHFDHDVHNVWSNFNRMQTILQEYADNYDPCVQFWEMGYVVAALPLAIKHGLKWILLGNELNAGREINHNGSQMFEELNQSWKFEHEYSDYVSRTHDIPVTLTSVIQPMTDFGCRKVMYREYPEFIEHVESCLRPTAAHGKWDEKCYKCAATWVESVALGVEPETFGMSHDILFKSPHLGADDDDWGYSFPKPNRDEVIWQDHNAVENLPNLNPEQLEGLETWRSRQEERTDEEKMDEYRKYYDKYATPVAEAIPEELQYNPGLEETTYVPEGYEP